MSKIIKIIDERETQKQAKNKKLKKGGRSYSEKVGDKWLCWAFKLGFLQLICKSALIFKLNLELALSIILRERELYESKHVVLECRYLKIWDVLSFFICSSILVWYVPQSFTTAFFTFLHKFKQKNFFNENEYNKLYPSGSAPAHIYGTPKMHKFSSSDSFPKLCPIVSSIGTFNYNLARFLCDLLSPLVPNDYSCKDTFSFVSQIKNANLSKKFLVFYDVTSLFTNIPLQETIDIAKNLIFNHNPNLNITRKELKKHHRLILFLTVSFIIKLME